MMAENDAAVEHARREADTDRLVIEMEALPAYRGWVFSYEYPGYFTYSHPDNDYVVCFTPDWEKDATIDIQVQTAEGADFPDWGDVLPLPIEGRSGEKLFEMVRPTLDKLMALPSSKKMNDEQIQALAEEALDAACKLIQDRLGVTSGDLAATVLSDGAVERELARYIRAELDQ